MSLRELFMKTMLALRHETDLQIQIPGIALYGDFMVPGDATGIVVFAHGSGSGRKSSRNRHVAGVLREHQLGTFLFDLLSYEEERIDSYTAQIRFDIPLLAKRLIHVTDWL